MTDLTSDASLAKTDTDNKGEKVISLLPFRHNRAKKVMVLLACLLIICVMFSLLSGAAQLDTRQVIFDLLGVSDQPLLLRDHIILYDVRLPRTVLGVLVGASLAVSGVMMQGIFRNPLADPGIVGVGTGAGLGAVLFIVLGQTILAPVSAFLGIYNVPIAAFIGGMITTWLLYRVSTSRGRTSVMTMLLAGIALGALAGAVMGILIFIANDNQLRDLTFWGLGSLAGATEIKVFSILPFMLFLLVGLPFMMKGLNALALGEAAAHHMGIQVQYLKNMAILLVGAATGASVAVTGGIGFVGIVVPHILRLLIGPDHRYLIPASALLGACILLCADVIARQIVAPAELPIGIVMSFIGGPVFLWILLKRRGQFMEPGA